MDLMIDALVDSLKLLPFLFITYLAIEVIEHTAGEKSEQMIRKAGRFGPIIGGITGIVPQCGFSAAASSLYVGRVINIGTLISVYLATSDEMLPIFISSHAPLMTIVKILGSKIAIAILSGLILELLYQKKKLPENYSEELTHHHHEHHEHCEEGHYGIIASATKQTLTITGLIFFITWCLNIAVHFFGEAAISSMFTSVPIIGCVVAAVVGLIPNCAASVLISQFYLKGMISPGSMMSGLLVAAGVGILVLFQKRGHLKEHLAIVGLLFAIGVFWGVIIDAVGITF